MQVGLRVKCSLELQEPNTEKKHLDNFLYNSSVQTHINNRFSGSSGFYVLTDGRTERSILIFMSSQDICYTLLVSRFCDHMGNHLT